MAASDSSGRVTLWLPTQSPFSSRENLAQALGVDVSRIRIIQPPIGGAFGAKLAGKPQHVAACLLAMRTHRPVKIVYDREEDMATMVPRVATTIHMRIGFKRDGTMTTKQARIIADNGAYSSHAYNIVFNMSQRMDCLYRFQHTRTETDLVYTNKIATGAFRGFGNPQSHFAMESCIDSASEALGLDPAEVRLKNASRQGDTTIHGWQLRSCALVDCIQKAAEGIGWKEKRHLKGSGRGVGMACVIHVSSNRKAADWDGSNALVKVHEDGRLAVVTGEVDMGQGTLTVLAQIAAEEFGVPIDRVEIGGVDTDIAPYCQGASSSRTVTLGGSAVRAAAADAKRQLLEVAAEKLEARVDDLEARGGRIFVRGAPDRAMTIGQAAKAHLFRKGGSAVIGRGSFDPPTRPPDEGFYGDLSTAYPFACQAAEVEVDRETGLVRVLNFVAAHDIGKVINPITAEGQVEGAVQQGMGYGLTEQLVFDGGKVLNNNLMNYLSLTAPDMPSIKTVFVESNDPWGPYGAKGLAEPGLIPTAPAIANAIFHAIGVRIPDLPITQEKVLRALKEQAQKA
ncbi:MAG: molybdopterin-dependent oxidoreductase, partial [Deltaproteobacteria bacterium]|nr:molybdopterin-dependent oxidoreductase [Deltaproteobacteria bacterium]